MQDKKKPCTGNSVQGFYIRKYKAIVRIEWDLFSGLSPAISNSSKMTNRSPVSISFGKSLFRKPGILCPIPTDAAECGGGAGIVGFGEDAIGFGIDGWGGRVLS